MTDSRRYRIYRVDYRHALDLFWIAMSSKEPSRISLPVLPEIPKDAIVRDVGIDWEYREIRFVVEHESFDVVPHGEKIPQVRSFDFAWRTFEIRLPEPEIVPIKGPGTVVHNLQWRTGQDDVRPDVECG